MRRFDGRTVLVTGAAKGQGRSHALAFAQQGASLVVCDIAEQIPCASRMGTPEELDETVRMAESVGAECLAVKADTRDPQQMRDLVAAGIDRFGGIDVLVANAGIAAFGPVRDTTCGVTSST